MSTPESRKGRRKLGLFAAVAAAFGLFLALGVSNAAASVSCAYNQNIGLVTITVNDQVPGGPSPVAPVGNTIVVKKGGGEGILVNGAFCTGGGISATTLNTDTIAVVPETAVGNYADGDDTLVIDTRAGRFVPGFTEDVFQPSLNEIEWYVNLGNGFNQVSIFDTDAAGAMVVGDLGGSSNWDPTPGSIDVATVPCYVPFTSLVPANGDNATFINMNAFPADDDADVYIPDTGTTTLFNDPNCVTTGAAVINLVMGGGDDFVSGKGSDGTGVATNTSLAINGGTGNDDLEGGLNDDLITPGPGTDFVDGNFPDVPFAFGLQDDVLGAWDWGFFGGDIVDFTGEAGPLTLTLNPDGSVTGSPDVVVGVEGIVGSDGNDTITGNNLANFLGGGAGDDTIDGLGGDDAVVGDAASVWDNTDGTVFIGEAATPGNDNLAGGLGNDTVLGQGGDDTLDENKPLDSSGAPAYGPLGNGADAIDGGEGVDTVTYSARTNRTVVYLGLISTFNDGADTNADGLTNEFDDVFFTTENVITGSGQDIISANFVNNRSNNVFTDNGGNDCVEGGPGNDTFQQGSAPQGADVMIGNTGSDTANYADRSGAVAVSLDGVANDGDIATNEGDNVGGFSVSCRPQTILVNPPLNGAAFFTDVFDNGDDLIFIGGVGIVPDFTFVTALFPFIDNITALLDAPVAGPAPSLFCGNLLLDGQVGVARTAQGNGLGVCPGETLGGDQSPLANVDVENVNGGSGDDILVGDNSGNVLNGNGGNDTLKGDASADQLNGGAGDDTIAGGPGNDAIDGGEGTNRADYASAGAGGVGVQVNLTTGVGTGEGNDTLKNIQNVNGSSFADAISGNDQDNILNGGGGNDAINGNAGNDTVNGGAGADQLKGASGDDKITGSEGNDSAQGGTGNDNIQGGNGKDTLLGQKGNDKLFGNAQPDFLNGGPGSDRCKPGSPGLARGDVVVNCES